MYTGKPYDTATGLYYEGARYYETTTGRFITQDSITGTKDDPMSLNRYVYAGDNPERYVDPSGHVLLSSDPLYRRGAAYNPTPTSDTSSSSKCTSSADVCLSRSGNNQYANGPPAAAILVIKTFNVIGAWAVSYDLVLGGAELTVFGSPVAFGWGLKTCGPLCAGAAAAATVGAGKAAMSGGFNAAVYDVQSGSDATPQGALKAAGSSPVRDFFCGVLDYLSGTGC
jgi:RHS repeat-associated protein